MTYSSSAHIDNRGTTVAVANILIYEDILKEGLLMNFEESL